MACRVKIEDFFTLEEINETLNELRRPVEVAVWSSENYYNFSAIIRTSHNFLVSKIWGIDLRDPEHPYGKPFYKKAAMTALKWEKKNIFLRSSEEFLEETKDRNIIACERRESLDTEDIRGFKYPDNPILLFGSEKFGVPDHLLKRANHIVSIPVGAFVTDHNISVAAGIFLYDHFNKESLYAK